MTSNTQPLFFNSSSFTPGAKIHVGILAPGYAIAIEQMEKLIDGEKLIERKDREAVIERDGFNIIFHVIQEDEHFIGRRLHFIFARRTVFCPNSGLENYLRAVKTMLVLPDFMIKEGVNKQKIHQEFIY